jgi:orotidine-5'-phosphate decarboxylase
MRSSIVFRDERSQATRSPVVLALDTGDLDQALDWAERAAPAVGMVKVGLQLFGAHGGHAVRALADEGHRVMLDLKLHDIPATVARAVRAVAELDAELLTVHALGGPRMLEAAVAAAGGHPTLAAVTVLTSHGAADLRAVGLDGPAAAVAARLARLALAAGCRALVCSPQEAAGLRAVAGPEVALVCPGVRPAALALEPPGPLIHRGATARLQVATRHSGSGLALEPPGPPDDQARVATPAEAVAAGADWLVVGRPITGAADPAAAAAAVRDEALAARARAVSN